MSVITEGKHIHDINSILSSPIEDEIHPQKQSLEKNKENTNDWDDDDDDDDVDVGRETISIETLLNDMDKTCLAWYCLDRPFTTLKLNNNTRILLIDVPGPLIRAEVLVRTGSLDEGNGQNIQASHMLEHLIGQMTSLRYSNAVQIQETLEDLGASWNASTTYYSTEYYINGPIYNWNTILDVLFSAVADSHFDPQVYERELNAVSQELSNLLNSGADNISTMVHMGSLFPGYDLGTRVTRGLENLSNLSLERLECFRKQHYIGENIVGVVAADFMGYDKMTPEDALPLRYQILQLIVPILLEIPSIRTLKQQGVDACIEFEHRNHPRRQHDNINTIFNEDRAPITVLGGRDLKDMTPIIFENQKALNSDNTTQQSSSSLQLQSNRNHSNHVSSKTPYQMYDTSIRENNHLNGQNDTLSHNNYVLGMVDGNIALIPNNNNNNNNNKQQSSQLTNSGSIRMDPHTINNALMSMQSGNNSTHNPNHSHDSMSLRSSSSHPLPLPIYILSSETIIVPESASSIMNRNRNTNDVDDGGGGGDGVVLTQQNGIQEIKNTNTLDDREIIHYIEAPDDDNDENDVAMIYLSFRLNILEGSKAYYVGELLSDILTGGFSSRLLTILRKQLGLVYTIDASMDANPGNSELSGFTFQTSTKPQHAIQVINTIHQELASICTQGLTREEMERVRNSIFASSTRTMYDLHPSKWTSEYGLNALWRRYRSSAFLNSKQERESRMVKSRKREQQVLESMFGPKVIRVSKNRIMQFQNTTEILSSITEHDIQEFVCMMIQNTTVLTVISPKNPFSVEFVNDQ